MKPFSRRDFLKLCGAGLGVATVQVALSAPQSVETAVNWLETLAAGVQTRFAGQLIRGTQQGQLFSSSDDGKSWSLLVNFGAHLAVDALTQSPDQRLLARFQFQGHSFWLQSSDGKRWVNYA